MSPQAMEALFPDHPDCASRRCAHARREAKRLLEAGEFVLLQRLLEDVLAAGIVTRRQCAPLFAAIEKRHRPLRLRRWFLG